MRRLSILGLVLFLFAGVAYASQDKPLSARQILDQMISAYASCSSYMDEGEVRTVFLEKNGPRTVTKPFSTAFVRPSDLRFEYKERRGEEEWDRYLIAGSADAVKSWWSLDPGVKNPENLTAALVEAAGVSNGSSVTIPSLLMPETGM